MEIFQGQVWMVLDQRELIGKIVQIIQNQLKLDDFQRKKVKFPKSDQIIEEHEESVKARRGALKEGFIT